MYRKAILLTVQLIVTAVFIWPSFANADVPAVDESRDIIVGKAEAPQTLVIYLSPGCTHCLYLQEQIVVDLARDHVATGNLRLVYRMIPDIFNVKEGEGVTDQDHIRALALSNLLANGLRCSYQEKGEQAFYKSLRALVSLYSSNAMRRVQRDFQWPYGTEETSSLLLGQFLRGSSMDRDFLTACQADGRNRQMKAIYDANRDGLESAGHSAVPTLFLDGELVSLLGGFGAAAEFITLRLPSLVSDEDAEFLTCRRREASIRLNLPESDIDGLIAGINNRSARTGPYQRRSANFWINVSDIWREAGWACGRY